MEVTFSLNGKTTLEEIHQPLTWLLGISLLKCVLGTGDRWGFPWHMLDKPDTPCVLWLVTLRPQLHCTLLPSFPHITLSVGIKEQGICASPATPSQAWARLSIHCLYHSTDWPYSRLALQYLSGLCWRFPVLKKCLNNLGDTNELTPHEADSLHCESCKMEWKAGSFYGLENREKQK